MVSPYIDLKKEADLHGRNCRIVITDYLPHSIDNSSTTVPGVIELHYDVKNATETEQNTLLNALKTSGQRKVILLMKDSSQDATRALEDVLRANGYKTVNQRSKTEESIPGALQNALEKYLKPDSIASYVKQGILFDSLELESQANRKTGFQGLDEKIGSLYSGLYVLGATSSLGKTTFCLQLADQLAERGNEVLFFSLEQSRLELVSKSLARYYKLTYKNKEESKTALDIRRSITNPSKLLSPIINDYYKKIGEHLSIIEGDFNSDVDSITEYVEEFVSNNGTRPIIFVDYLQVLQPSLECTKRRITDTQRIIDYNVTELKRLSRRFNVPVIVVSSFNRSNYQNQVDFESFKGSGGIEYTADVVLALQLQVVKEFDERTGINEKREKITKAKNEEPREIELACKKNRYGRSNFEVSFKYYPSCDYFYCT